MTIIPPIATFDAARLPVEGSSTFRADATYMWSTVITVANNINASSIATNTLAGEIEAIGLQVSNDKVLIVEKEALVNPHYSAIDSVSANITDINSIVTDVIPQMPAILNSATNAQTASDKAIISTSSAATAVQAKVDAQAISDGLVTQLPAGSINDVVASSTTTYSSQEIENKIGSIDVNTYVDGGSAATIYSSAGLILDGGAA